jgi:hypothetical protein
MEQEPSVNQLSTYPPSLSLQQSGSFDFGQIMAMFQNGLPSIDKLPVERTYCGTCRTVSPRIFIMGFSAVICPDCCQVFVDEPK